MPEIVLVAVGLALAAPAVLAPLRRPATTDAPLDDDREAAELRHRVALEAIRDLDADHRAGSISEAEYRRLMAEAEERAAATRAVLEAAPATPPHRATRRAPTGVAAAAAAVIGLLLVGGSAIPATGLANGTVVDEELAAARRAQEARRERIGELTQELAARPDDPDPATLSELADLYLAGSSDTDLRAAATALLALIQVEPERTDAYERLIAAYLRAGSYDNARATLDSYAELEAADPVEIAFFDGLIALRGESDPSRAAETFDRFLELAPDDPRAPMVRALRDEAAGSPPPSPTP